MPKVVEHRTRKQVLVLRLNAEERGLLDALAEDSHLSMSDTMRLIVRETAKRRGIVAPATPSPRRRRP